MFQPARNQSVGSANTRTVSSFLSTLCLICFLLRPKPQGRFRQTRPWGAHSKIPPTLDGFRSSRLHFAPHCWSQTSAQPAPASASLSPTVCALPCTRACPLKQVCKAGPPANLLRGRQRSLTVSSQPMPFKSSGPSRTVLQKP